MSRGTENGAWRRGVVRVLHVVDSLGVGGAELGVLKIGAYLNDDFTHFVCGLRDWGAVGDRLRELGIPVTVLGSSSRGSGRVALEFARLCRKIRPLVVHTRNWGAVPAVVGARIARVPAVIHAEHGFNADALHGGAKRREWARRLLAPWIDRFVAVSAHLKAWLVDEVGIQSQQVFVIREGIDTTRFRPLAERGRLRAEYGYRQGDFVVGTVGRLDPVKNHGLLLDAFALVSDRCRRLRIAVVGDGCSRQELRRRIGARGADQRVRLFGQRDDIPALLNAFDLFVLPSLFEGTSNALLEAMAVGLPVVATRVGGTPEIVVDGATGRMVPVGDPGALAEAIASYAGSESDRREHGRAGRTRVVENFSLDRMIDGYRRVYEEVIATRLKGWRPADRGPQPG